MNIRIVRAEGKHDECDIPVLCRDFAQSDIVLKRWAKTAPQNGYDKCDFTVTASGNTYSGRFDLHHSHVDGHNMIADQMKAFVTYQMDNEAKAFWLPLLGTDNVVSFPVKSVPVKVIPQLSTVTDTLISNEFCSVHLRSDKEVSGADLTDRNNEPRFYNQTVRGLKKAWAALALEFTADTSMYGAIDILSKHGIRCHSYCAMD